MLGRDELTRSSTLFRNCVVYHSERKSRNLLLLILAALANNERCLDFARHDKV